MPNTLLTGKPRTVGGGARPWRTTLYRPTGRYKSFRVTFKEHNADTDTWEWTARNAKTEADARTLFDQVERALDLQGAAPAKQRVAAARTMKALGELYLEDSKRRLKQARTLEQRESKLRAHIVPTIGDLPVAQWRTVHSQKVMDKAAKTVKSVQGLSDVRTQLSGMLKLAWREQWLDRSIDPLDGIDTPKPTVQEGAHEDFIDEDLRPETRQVEAMARAADYLCGVAGDNPQLTRLPLTGEKIRIAGYGGLRLGEQHALRAIDVDFERGCVNVNGSWTRPRGEVGFRGPVKNRRVHDVPLPRSVLNALLPRVRELLGLPASASLQQVRNAQALVRAERTRLAKEAGTPGLRWYEVQVPPEEELWLFVDTVTGLPPRPELFNDRWHDIREWVEVNDLENAWPRTIVYRNLRHHAASSWFHDTLGEDWPAVARYLGDRLQTVLDHYVRVGEDALKATVEKLANY